MLIAGIRPSTTLYRNVSVNWCHLFYSVVGCRSGEAVVLVYESGIYVPQWD